MNEDKLMDPAYNDLMPSDEGSEIDPPELSADYEERPKPVITNEDLTDPKQNDLMPNDDDDDLPPELSADYEEKPRPAITLGHGIDWISEELMRTKVDPCGFDDGLQLRRTLGEGLHVFKGERIICDLISLEPDELFTIKNYLERSLHARGR